MKCKKCKGELNKEFSQEVRDTRCPQLCAFCDGTIFQRIKEAD